MPQSPSSDIPYQGSGDSPNGPLLGQNMALRLDKMVAPPFASIAARDAKIPSPTQGQICTVAGRLHTYDGSKWCLRSGGYVSATTDVNGNLIVAHGLGVTPTVKHATPTGQASDLLTRVIALKVTNADSINIVVSAVRTDTSAYLASNLVQFSWTAEVI